mmetsp:Transcript_20795/g.39522  ORF Transcript_20795/g.39522 Transcript_20795/m.39522 type:complete len:231 (+) Transcript_20795:819-1511(+)
MESRPGRDVGWRLATSRAGSSSLIPCVISARWLATSTICSSWSGKEDMTLSKSSRLSENKSHWVMARQVEMRGSLKAMAISPKKEPASSTATHSGTCSSAPSSCNADFSTAAISYSSMRRTSTLPFAIRNISLPTSPWWQITSPEVTNFAFSRFTISSTKVEGVSLNMGIDSTMCLQRCLRSRSCMAGDKHCITASSSMKRVRLHWYWKCLTMSDLRLEGSSLYSIHSRS